MQNQNLNVDFGYDADVVKALSNRDRVRRFWRYTTLSDAEFKDYVLKLLGKSEIDVFNDITPKFLRSVIDGFIAKAVELHAKEYSNTPAEKSWRIVCIKLATYNRDNYWNSDGAKKLEKLVRDQDYGLLHFDDAELVLSLMANYIRSLLRDDFAVERPEEGYKVDLDQGVDKRIWQTAAKKYLREEFIVDESEL